MIDYAIGIPVVLGQVEVVKRFVPDAHHRWALPVAALALGLLWSFSLAGTGGVAQRVAGGVLAGLSAMGGFDGTRAIAGAAGWGARTPPPPPA